MSDPLAHPLPEALVSLIARRFKILGEPMRIRLLDQMRDGSATVGELARNQLFYAAARGLDPASARALLLEGFVGGLWDEIDGDDQGIADMARAALKAVA